MLTKDQLKFNIRGDRVKPVFIGLDDGYLDTVDLLIEHFRKSTGLSLKEFEETLQLQGDSIVFSGLKKTLLDQCRLSEITDDIEHYRWDMFAHSVNYRRSANHYEEFECALQRHENVTAIRKRLFSDLPENRLILAPPQIGREDVLNLYNISQVKGLLWFTKNLRLRIREKDPVVWRRVFQSAKFFRLIIDFEFDLNTHMCVMNISGPLSIFDNSQTYAMRISQLFPTILHLTQWELDADLKVKNRDVRLMLNQDCGIKPLKDFKGYRPPEFEKIATEFNCESKEYMMIPGENPISLGKSIYLFPDFTIKRGGHDVFHLELFHKWHRSNILARFDALKRFPRNDIRIGLSRALTKDLDIQNYLNSCEHARSIAFEFGDFPTPRQLLKLLPATE